DPSSPVHLELAEDGEWHPIFRSARVGLSLKRSVKGEEAPNFLVRHYRFLTEPKKTAKGKVYMVLAAHARGMSAEEIANEVGCAAGTVRLYTASFEAGKKEADSAPYFGIDLGNDELGRLDGMAAARGW